MGGRLFWGPEETGRPWLADFTQKEAVQAVKRAVGGPGSRRDGGNEKGMIKQGNIIRLWVRKAQKEVRVGILSAWLGDSRYQESKRKKDLATSTYYLVFIFMIYLCLNYLKN